MSAPSPEAIERMMAFVRNMANATSCSPLFREAAEIAALLPEPIDPDLIEARKVIHRVLMDKGASGEAIFAGEVLAGERDDALFMHVAIAAIKLGRVLAEEDR
ncbi:hypothetical protein [Sphingomonas montanisoli]|uniref:Uncharacterized protein n=1 Tax=Sphingomonas montanisoli TaxID=2606412 RepID=A0A5D9C190_9SPHN|nr:hypothetical protein [Sphingomonas montanisoli]TZG25618.1 hypothetical protein FYJ91_11370 [Sphingomonas montanisoli]